MQAALIEKFAPAIRALTNSDLNDPEGLQTRFAIGSHGNLTVCYAPFEHVNLQARVMIVGITPGMTQMSNALREARDQLCAGADVATTLKAAKQTGAFSGPMRPNLIALLDSVGVSRVAGVGSCAELFANARHLVQTTSVLRNPVFVSGKNYAGNPSMLRTPLLTEELMRGFAEEARVLDRAVFVPLGDKVSEALHFVAQRGAIDANRILDGLPHPSGANAERIAYFLGRKQRTALSAKTNADKLDHARDELRRQVSQLAA